MTWVESLTPLDRVGPSRIRQSSAVVFNRVSGFAARGRQGTELPRRGVENTSLFRAAGNGSVLNWQLRGKRQLPGNPRAKHTLSYRRYSNISPLVAVIGGCGTAAAGTVGEVFDRWIGTSFRAASGGAPC